MVFSIVVFGIVYVLIASEKVNRVAAVLAGAGIILAVGAVTTEDAFYSTETGIDWNVIFLLFGMMVIVGVLKLTGVFEYVAIWATKKAKGRPFRVMALLSLITAVASAGLDNVTTVLLIAPVTLLVCERIGVRPIPFLIAEALASNIGGTATLVGDPPNLIVASKSGLGFNDFLINLGPIVVVMLVAFVALSRLLFRKDFVADPEQVAQVMTLDEKEAIRDRPLLVKSLIVLALVLAGFTLHGVLHLEPSVVALLGAGILIAISGLRPKTYLADVEWETLLFFAGLFILVGSLVKVGVIDQLANLLVEATNNSVPTAMMVLLWGSATLSAIVDNIPFVATMTPVVSELVAPGGQYAGQDGLWWALVLGADLGGNATAIGASANVVVAGIAKRNGHPISFWEFTRYGLVVAVVTLAIATPYLLLRY
ncbi:MAG TPA: ArsB/NhaD family transporter [Propionicimonas sp.]|jgi:Na+/H+ antiporter NhaD/arsenite permease-like protein|nr:ArsB/NhaD family transporter [Propionicimonas sp.]